MAFHMAKKRPLEPLSLQNNMIWNSIGSLTNLGCQWLTTVLVVRLSSGFDAAGILAIAMSIANIYAPIAQFKMRTYQVSDVEHHTSSGEYVAFRLISMSAAFLISILYMLFTADSYLFPAVICYLLYKSVEVFIDVLHGIDQQHYRMDYCGKSLILRGVLSLLAFAVVLHFTNNLNYSIFAMFFSVLPVIALDWHRASFFGSLRPHISKRKTGSLFLACLPAAVGTSLCNAVTTIARQQLGAIEGAAVLGIYASVCTPIVLIQAGAGYIYAPLLGKFAEYLNSRDIREFNRLLIKVSAVIVFLALSGIALFYAVGGPFLNLVFGSEVARNSYLMYPAVISVVLCAYSSFLCDLLIAARSMLSTLLCNALSVIIVSIMVNPLITMFGSNGASFAISLSYGLGSIAMLALLLYSVTALCPRERN